MKRAIKKLFKSNYLFTAGVIICVFWIAMAILAPLIAPYDPIVQDLSIRLKTPSASHIFGTDNFGRDIFSRVIYGGRYSLLAGLLTVIIAGAIGTFYGAIAGYVGGQVDNVIMRIMDIFACVPMLLMCVVIAAILGPSIRNAIIAIAISTTPSYARLMRANILTVRDKEFIEAARAINCGNARIILKHIIPNAIAPLIVSITMNLGNSIISGATLSFIGLGAQPPLAEWGAMLADGRNFMRDHMELVLYPGICIMITVLAFNLLGDGLRDAMDPRLKN